MPSEHDPLLGHANGHHREQPSRWAYIKRKLNESVDPNASGYALACQCIISGASDVATFSQTNTWAAFMTGNLTQLAMSGATAILVHPAPDSVRTRLYMSLSAVFGFIIGCFVAALVDTRFHSKHRGKLICWALARAALYAVVAPLVARHGWEGTSGMMFLFTLAIAMGSMAVNATRLGSTPFATTVVFTSTLSSLFSDPLLPLGLTSASRTRAFGILSLMLGGIGAQAIMILTAKSPNSIFTQPRPVGSSNALYAVAVVEIIAAVCWWRVRAVATSP